MSSEVFSNFNDFVILWTQPLWHVAAMPRNKTAPCDPFPTKARFLCLPSLCLTFSVSSHSQLGTLLSKTQGQRWPCTQLCTTQGSLEAGRDPFEVDSGLLPMGHSLGDAGFHLALSIFTSS